MDETVCPVCGRPIRDGEPRVSWFSKAGGEVDKRGAVHLACLTPVTTELENRSKS